MALKELLLIIAGILFAIATLFTKKVVTQENIINKFIIGVAVAGSIGGLLMIYSLKFLPLWEVMLIVNLTGTIGAVFLSYFILGETMTLLQIFLVVIGIAVLGLLGFVGRV